MKGNRKGRTTLLSCLVLARCWSFQRSGVLWMNIFLHVSANLRLLGDATSTAFSRHFGPIDPDPFAQLKGRDASRAALDDKARLIIECKWWWV